MKYLIFIMTLLPLSIMAHAGHENVVLHDSWISAIGYLMVVAAILLATGWLKRKMVKCPVKK